MSNNKESIKQYVCPSCFAREIDVIVLHYDEEDQEYYCRRCAYAGKQDVVERFFKDYKEQKYKEMNVPHPGDRG